MFEMPNNGDFVVSLAHRTLVIDPENGNIKASMAGGTIYPLIYDDERFYWLRGADQRLLDKTCIITVYDKNGNKL